MKKTFILDTSVFVFDPYCLTNKKFTSQDIIIPIQILEELDKLKKGFGEAAKNARLAIRQLDSIENLHIGQKLENKSFVKIQTEGYDKIGEDDKYNDNKILACVQACKKKNKVLLSQDINLRVRAKALGLDAEDYKEEKKDVEEFYSGIIEVKNDDWVQEIMEKGFVDLKNKKTNLFPHQGIIFKDDKNQDLLIGRKIEDKIINVKKQEVWGITSRNNEQQMALHLLMDNSIPLVSLAGAPGAGKTLLALAAALELVLNRKKYSKIIVYRPVDMVGGQDIGFLPGNKFEKIISYMGAILDSFEVLFSNDQSRLSGKKQKDWMSNFEMFVEKGIIELDSIGFTRGRSIHDSIILLDDCQNFSKENLKTILTRINASSRIFMMGDQDQIDVKDIDMETNAVSIASEVFKESKLVAHLRLKETQRSPLAAEAIKLL